MSSCFVTCGDGLVYGLEACDDGNTENHDGCSKDCALLEPGFLCSPGDQFTATTCSDIDGCALASDTDTGPMCVFDGDLNATCLDVPGPGTGYTCLCTEGFLYEEGPYTEDGMKDGYCVPVSGSP
jgi:cysteine-rich repeat protein